MEPRRVADLAQLSDPRLFEEVSAGLELISENAARLWESVRLLAEQEHHRAAQILKAVATEEAAKYLILLDAIRCPRKPDAKRFTDQLKKYYSHLARGLYAEVCDWRPLDLKELRVNIERECSTYYLDGPNDVDWIFRNDILRQREEALYVDFVEYGDAHEWVSPRTNEALGRAFFFTHAPAALRLVSALHSAGFDKPEALEIIAQTWRLKTFADDSASTELRAQTVQTIRDLEDRGLLESNDGGVYTCIADLWPFPLYGFAMRGIQVDKKHLKEIQNTWHPDV